jgi:hypothetical protein
MENYEKINSTKKESVELDENELNEIAGGGNHNIKVEKPIEHYQRSGTKIAPGGPPVEIHKKQG